MVAVGVKEGVLVSGIAGVWVGKTTGLRVMVLVGVSSIGRGTAVGAGGVGRDDSFCSANNFTPINRYNPIITSRMMSSKA